MKPFQRRRIRKYSENCRELDKMFNTELLTNEFSSLRIVGGEDVRNVNFFQFSFLRVLLVYTFLGSLTVRYALLYSLQATKSTSEHFAVVQRSSRIFSFWEIDYTFLSVQKYEYRSIWKRRKRRDKKLQTMYRTMSAFGIYSYYT